MKRYIETIFRYWVMLLVPIVVLSLIGAIVIKQQPKTVLASAKIWVEPSSVGSAANYNPWVTPAQNESDALTELLQISSFDWTVAQGSAIYKHMLTKVRSPQTYAIADIQKNMQFSAPGGNLVYIGYSSKDWALGLQIVQSFLDNAVIQMQQLDQQQATSNLVYNTAQLRTAQQRLNQSSQQLTQFMHVHNIASSAMSVEQLVDPPFASLYRQVQSDQQSVQNLQQKIADLQALGAGNPGAVQGGYRVVDPPSVVLVSSKKKDLLNLAIFLGIGLALSGSFVAAKTLLDRSFRYADEVPELLELPVLAVVPYDATLAASRSGGARSSRIPPGDRSGQRRIG